MVYEFVTKNNDRFIIRHQDIIGLIERPGEVGILTKTNCWFVLHSYDELKALLFPEIIRLEH